MIKKGDFICSDITLCSYIDNRRWYHEQTDTLADGADFIRAEQISDGSMECSDPKCADPCHGGG